MSYQNVTIPPTSEKPLFEDTVYIIVPIIVLIIVIILAILVSCKLWKNNFVFNKFWL